MSGSKKEKRVIITDLADGDDYAALAYMLACAQVEQTSLQLVSSYGNRSTAVTHHNLLSALPQLQSNLRSKSNPAIGILRGADRPTGAAQSYELHPDDVVYKIHGDMGYDRLGGTQMKVQVHLHQLTTTYRSWKRGRKSRFFLWQQLPKLQECWKSWQPVAQYTL